MAEISIQLMGGEKDGWPDKITVKDGKHPELVFVWATEHDARINKAKGDAKAVLVAKLGVLAYKYLDKVEKPDKIDGVEYRYVRHPQADKKMTSV